MATKLAALYYPHIAIENEGLLKNALMLWDIVELICPFEAFPYLPEDPDRRAAFEIIARPLQPSEQEMSEAHEVILEIANSNLPDWFFPERVNKDFHYYLHPEKFLSKTWDELQRSRLAQPVYPEIEPPTPRSAIRAIGEKARQRAFQTTQAFGLTMLSILADCCGGTHKQLVTDEVDSYAALDRYLKLIGGAGKLPWWSRERAHDRLVTMSIELADVSGVRLSSLWKIRERESAESRLRTMRHNYVAKIESYIARLSKEARSAGDVREISRMFQKDVADDISLLREELKDEGKKVIFSKEVLGAAALVSAGIFVEPAAALLLAAGALYKAKVDFKTARNKTLDKHPMSWLYEMRRVKVV
jgi:hypothetical protein